MPFRQRSGGEAPGVWSKHISTDEHLGLSVLHMILHYVMVSCITEKENAIVSPNFNTQMVSPFAVVSNSGLNSLASYFVNFLLKNSLASMHCLISLQILFMWMFSTVFHDFLIPSSTALSLEASREAAFGVLRSSIALLVYCVVVIIT